MAKPKAPAGCYWKRDTLYAQIQVNGKREQRALYTDNPKLAAERLKKLKEEMIADVKFGDAPRLFEDVMEPWAANLDKNVQSGAIRPNTAKRYLMSLDQLGPYLEGRKLSEITVRFVGDIVADRQKSGATNRTIKNDLVALSSVLTYAIGRGWSEHNPTLVATRNVKVGAVRVPQPRDEDVALVISRCNPMWQNIVRVAVATGARLDEIMSSRRSSVDHKRKTWTVTGKGDKTRLIDLAPFGGYDLIKSIPTHLGCDYLFWHDDGKPFRNASSNFANNMVAPTATWAKKNGVKFKPFRFHDLRHKHAFNWLADGRDIYVLQQRLGHSSIKVTEMYVANGDAKQVKAA